MFRVLNAVSVVALLLAAGVVYQVKYSAAFEAQKIAKLRDEIRSEKDRIALLNAEWARRTAPGRIQELAENHLDMQPLDINRMDQLASLPAKADANGDPLAGMIEALVDGPSSNPAEHPPAPTAAKPATPKPNAKTVAAARLPGDGLPPDPATAAETLPLSAIPAAGNMAPARSRFTGPQGTVGDLDPVAADPYAPRRGDGR
ncbi:hypothetical protein FHS55_003114 [Angulomicrobium tetraedrale]|uniref:Cell division protein FtsL n=1 Tax=Ancylobacter tetraedralis TaxID=217068 RepID=A0A839ZCX1_9HYPH|nr:hypothetical protein [Ancylobacter tetraedralis]MBB3772502.1 hypothetical protein [Ancylobacter tetraedralis]